MKTSYEQINELARLNNADSYLEIGVAEGRTFTRVEIRKKVAVDPHFKFDTSACNYAGEFQFYEQTSDVFFDNLKNNDQVHAAIPGKFDIVFIDGLHLFRQAMRDFTNVLPYVGDRTIFVFDDTVPSDPWSASKDAKINYVTRRMAGIQDWPWHGDTYKCIFALHDFYPDFSYATVCDCHNPRTVVWRTSWPREIKRIFNSLEDIEHMDYFDMLGKAYVLNLVSWDDLMGGIGDRWTIKEKDSSQLWPLIVKPLNVANKG